MKKREPLYILVSIGIIISTIANAQLIPHADSVIYTKNLKLQDHFYLNSAGMIIGSVEYESTLRQRPARVSALKNDTAINLSPGELSGILTSSQKATITNLQLTGSIDARDFKTMRDSMPALSAIDINTVSVSAYTGTQGTAGSQNITYPAGYIPQSAFSLGNNTVNFKLTSIILPTSITSIGDSAFYNCGSLTGNLIIPGLVTSIGNNAFESCGMNGTLILPNSLTTIGVKAFYLCQNITGLTLSESLTSISVSAFDGDWALQGHLTIPNSVTSIGNNAFFYCGFSDVTIPNSVTSIGAGAFGKCKMLSGNVTIPNSITAISDYTFALCGSLTSVTLPNSVTSIGENAFTMSALASIILPNSIISIGDWAFSLSNLTSSFVIPNSLATIGHGTFSSTGITEFIVENENPNFSAVDGVLFSKDKTRLIAYIPNKHGAYTIPDFVTSIGNYAFDYCNGLTGITIPQSVVSIGGGAFYSCFGLTSITVNSITPIALTDSVNVFGQTQTSVLYVPAGSKAFYESANQWKNFKRIVEMSPTGINIDLADGKQFILYPNLVSEGFYILAGADEWSSVSIYNSGGMLLFLSQVKGKSYIDIANLPRGLYIVKISVPNGTIENKLLKK
ncbi:MAG TPA: leucine-rich repeat domain-containing protein [Paludibacter sp.]|nr:leucine-rich repeat domain-containing protein [Paludibacter sp.]